MQSIIEGIICNDLGNIMDIVCIINPRLCVCVCVRVCVHVCVHVSTLNLLLQGSSTIHINVFFTMNAGFH